MPEPIQFTHYPIWERQPGEDENAFLNFTGYYLPSPKASVRKAYQNWINTQKGTNSSIPETVSGQWQENSRDYRWAERHRAYWLHTHQENLSWVEQQRRELMTLELTAAQLMMERAIEILALPTDPDRASPKDAAVLARASSELGRLALGLDNLDKCIDVVQKSGFQVILPEHLRELYVPQPPQHTQNSLPQSGGSGS